MSNADLVVLSACQTQFGKLNSGDDVIGLNRASIYAGSPAVVTREDIVSWTRMDQHGYEKPNTITRYDPVLQGLGFTRTEELRRTGSVIDLSKHANKYIEWEIYTDSAPTVHGKIRVGDL